MLKGTDLEKLVALAALNYTMDAVQTIRSADDERRFGGAFAAKIGVGRLPPGKAFGGIRQRVVPKAGDAGERERLEGQRPVGAERLPLPAAGAGRFAGDRDARRPSHLSCHQSDSRKMTVLECKGATILRGDGWQPVRGCAKVKNVLHYAEKNPQILFSCEKKNLKMLLERVT